MRCIPATCIAMGLALATVSSHATAFPLEFVAVDITDWTPAQRASLPVFKHYVALQPAGAPANYSNASRTAWGLHAGNRPQGSIYAGYEATLVWPDASLTSIDPFGTYNWGYWSWDGDDWHYYWGYVRDSVALDVNYAGVAVGKATLGGSGTSSNGATYHAWTWSPDAGRIDILPDEAQAWATCINNRGEIGGYAYGGGTLVGGYRRSPDGQVAAMHPVGSSHVQPRWINAAGVIIGSYYNGAFVSRSGAFTEALTPLGSHPRVVAYDINDSGWIVGLSGPWNEQETFATLWKSNAAGTNWNPLDLTEYLVTPDVLLESAVAINNDGCIIAKGHPDDGNDLFGSRTYLLTPVTPFDPPCAADIGVHPPLTADYCVGETLAASIEMAEDDGTLAYRWQRNAIDLINGQGDDGAVISGATTPQLLITGLTPSASGDYRCVVTNACSSTPSNTMSVTVTVCCAGDADNDSDVDFDDLNVILSHWETLVPVGMDGDVAPESAPDGVVNFADLNVVLGGFGSVCE